ncbi:hypothetical protein GR183_10170 [Stappia sp. GBMRC 2046]|uniref:Uncharacterized protein n=1 Tax=Stappia sediminis TaxID=2692190 RepID=A0A7X3S805_9HYPH|nr:hypothetical protein [Stappia sediminis]MXN65265.1 hypothetical protein [Stappia sediminis]
MTSKSKLNSKLENIIFLKEEFEGGLDFNEKLYTDLEIKARHYLTLLIPTLTAIIIYIFNNYKNLSDVFILLNISISINILLSTIFFAASVNLKNYDSGRVHPPDWDINNWNDLIENNQNFSQDLLPELAKKRLLAWQKNSKENRNKSQKIITGQRIIFLAPLSCFLSGITFIFLSDISGKTVSIILGLGLAAAVAFLPIFSFYYHHNSRS